MRDIIDNELAEKSSLDLPTIFKWLLIGILGCIVFQSFEYFTQRIIVDLLSILGIAGGATAYLISEIIGLVLVIAVFINVIEAFKKRYYANSVNLRKTINTLIRAYIIIVVIQFVYPFITEYLGIYTSLSDAPDFLSGFSYMINIFYAVETFIKYGIVVSILLKTD